MTTAAPTYDPARAWQRAAAFCILATASGLAVGVAPELLHVSTSHPHRISWWFAVAACVIVEVVAYWVIWPRGTFTLERRRDVPAALAIGVPWGVAQGIVFLMFWELSLHVSGNRAIAALLAFGLISAYQGLFHALWWDRHVAPPHNKPEWNLPKVLLCHIPNLAATLSFLAVYGDYPVFVCFQVVALVGSAYYMRFPRPRSQA